MNTEDLFKFGVTPKSKSHKGYGKRFDVIQINARGLDVRMHGTDNAIVHFDHGSYDLWQEPKTLFEDRMIESTWGNLKKAMEAAGLGDETKFAVHDFIIGFREAVLRKEKLQDNHGHEKTYIIVE